MEELSVEIEVHKREKKETMKERKKKKKKRLEVISKKLTLIRICCLSYDVLYLYV